MRVTIETDEAPAANQFMTPGQGRLNRRTNSRLLMADTVYQSISLCAHTCEWIESRMSAIHPVVYL
jgi:hypothetical protein